MKPRVVARVVVFAAALAVLAAPAGAATRYVTQTARGSGSGVDSTNAQSLANFNAAAVAGDVALLMGNFSGVPNPARSGTGSAPIVYRSRSGKPNDVCLTGGLNITGSACDSNVVWRDITIRGATRFGGATETGRFQLRNARLIDSGVNMTYTRDCHLDSVYCTDTTPSTSGLVLLNSGTNACQRDTVRNSSFAVLNADGTGSTAVHIFTGYDNFYEAVRCTVTTSTNTANIQLRFGRVCATVRGMMKDCYFVGTNNTPGGGNDEPMCFSFKDGVAGFKMYRDTIITRGTNNGAAPWISLAQSEDWGAIGGNTFRNCYFRNESSPSWGVVWNTGFDGDSVVGNTFITKSGTVATYDHGTAVSPAGTIVDHNFFVSFGQTPALIMDNSSANQSVTFTNNIFYAPALTNSDTSSVRAVSFGNAAGWGAANLGPVGNNNNIAWMPGTSTKRAVQWSGGVSAFGMSPWLGARSPASLDGASKYGSLRLVDSTLARFDAHPLSGSASLTGPDGYLGPFGLGGPPDVIPPSPVLDLAAGSPAQHALTLTWTAPGNDALVGTASAYDLRWSSSTITALNWAAATPIAGVPAPAPAGSHETVTVSGLLANTIYHFALMTRDAAGNWSLLSLDAAGTTLPDTTPPAVIGDFRPNTGP